MIATWLASLAPSLVKRTLLALGFGVAVIAGISSVAGQLQEYIYANVNGLPADLLGIMNLAGMGTGLNIVLGAIVSRVTLHVLVASSRVIGV